MAYSEEQWNKAKEYFEAGLSLSEINLRTDISRPQISKKAKRDKWEKGNEKKQLIAQHIEVEVKKKQLNETALIVHNEIVDETLRRQNLVYNIQEKALNKANNMIEKIDTPFDLKTIVETVDKASITLGVNQRHANSQVNIQNTNAQQTNIDKDLILNTLKTFENEY